MSDQTAVCKILDAAGAPVPLAFLRSFHCCDFLMRPVAIAPKFAPGEVRFAAPDKPFRIALALAVPGFGQVYVYADNRGRGYTPESFTEPLSLNAEFAAGRLESVRRLVEDCARSGIILPAATQRRVEAAAALLAQSKHFESLAEGLWAGEEIVFERTRQVVERRGARPGFLFGCNSFGYPKWGKPYADRFGALFDYATLPFYVTSVEKIEGQPDYSRIEKILGWLDGTAILKKGHPLVWMNPKVLPAWLKGKTFEEARRIATGYARRSVLRFRGRIHVWDVINEAHLQNALDFTAAEQIEITRAATEAAREADPTCFRIINSCCTWNDYIRKPQPGRRTVYDYLDEVTRAGIGFEAIGLQYYYGGRDLLETERSLETFRRFGKPVHITELGLPSSSEKIENAWHESLGFPWHGREWSETAQADWVERFYTLAFSKPWIEAITWWDLTDPAFVPHGGLLNRDLTPKESYRRLAALLKKWRGMDASGL